MRISRHQMFMLMARAASMRSTCFRLNVGAVIVRNRRPLSIGYNGAPEGKPHCLGNDCPGREHCQETIHAEMNAIKHLPGGALGPLDIYVTHSPCEYCARAIVDYGFRRVFFEIAYRETEHLPLLSQAGIEMYQVTPAGYLVNFETKEVVELAT